VVAKNVIIHGHGAFTMEIPGRKAGMLGALYHHLIISS